MEQSWTIRGAYADWKVTVTSEPPTPVPERDQADWPPYHFDGLAKHFADLVNVAESFIEEQRP